MLYERGPSEPSAMPLRPRVVTPGRFQALGAELAAVLGWSDGAFNATGGTFGQLMTWRLGPAFDRDVTPAAAALDVIQLGSDNADLVVAGWNGEWIDGDLDRQARDLPGPYEDEPAMVPTPEGPPTTPPFEDFPMPPDDRQ